LIVGSALLPVFVVVIPNPNTPLYDAAAATNLELALRFTVIEVVEAAAPAPVDQISTLALVTIS